MGLAITAMAIRVKWWDLWKIFCTKINLFEDIAKQTF
jgi:hypothetical protein